MILMFPNALLHHACSDTFISHARHTNQYMRINTKFQYISKCAQEVWKGET